MIIKSVFRRYERWNPVHPTSGAFWGVGLGVGCGVGWGPGFGPEVIGYVGAGCGVGFSVGFTLLGVGIGLPTNYVFTAPYNAFMATRRDVAQSRGLLGNRGRTGDGWGDISSLICDLQQNRHESFPCFKMDNRTEGMIDLNDVKSELGFRAKYITDSLQRVTGRFFPWDRDRGSRS